MLPSVLEFVLCHGDLSLCATFAISRLRRRTDAHNLAKFDSTTACATFQAQKRYEFVCSFVDLCTYESTAVFHFERYLILSSIPTQRSISQISFALFANDTFTFTCIVNFDCALSVMNISSSP